MKDIHITIEQLRDMIGVTVRHEGTYCKIIEVLEDGPQLVLIDLDTDSIQADQFGNAHRRAPQAYIIPVMAEAELHPSYLALEIVE